MAERIVEVEWEDSACSHGWQTRGDLPETWIARSVGYVDRDDADGIRIYEGRSIIDTKGREHKKESVRDYGCAMMIPRISIRRVRELGYRRHKGGSNE